MKTALLWLWRFSLFVAWVYIYTQVNGDGTGNIVISEPLVTLFALWYGVFVPYRYYKLVADNKKEDHFKYIHQLEIERAVEIERRKWEENTV
jgi:hypothetical protein